MRRCSQENIEILPRSPFCAKSTVTKSNLNKRMSTPINDFHAHEYLRHNARRLEHLASLSLPVSGSTVLEVGAGIGDHSHYYIDRGCKITITEARKENLDLLRKRYPGQEVLHLDLESPSADFPEQFDIVHSYGLLYHLGYPAEAISYMSKQTRKMMFLETCVSFGGHSAINLVPEPQSSPTQSVTGVGCRPTRPWIFNELSKNFEYVYMPLTQPNHREFPLDWQEFTKTPTGLTRAVFICSRDPIQSDLLVNSIPDKQARHA